MKQIELNTISGTSDQIAEEIFKKIIGPMVDEMNSQDKDSAKVFTFSVMWLGMLYMLLNLNRTMPRKQFNLVLISSCKRSTNSAKDRAKEQQHDRFE